MIDDRANTSLTTGCWATEQQAEEYFTSFVQHSGLFIVRRQIPGSPLWKHPFQQIKQFRADVLLFPREELLRAGWTQGAIVIEVKRSGEKIGLGLSQLLDYVKAGWFTRSCVVIPTFGFLFPAPKQHGPLASVMSQQRIGTIDVPNNAMKLLCGESRVLTFTREGTFEIGALSFGRKAGAR